MPPIRITPHNSSLLSEWYSEAVNDIDVSRFMTTSPHLRHGPETVISDWEDVQFISSNHRGRLSLSFRRSECMRSASVGIWTINNGDKAAAHHAASELYRFLLTNLCYQYPLKRLDFTVHGSNHHVRTMYDKWVERGRLTRWGICPEDSWDSKLGIWADTIYYSFIIPPH
jgi:hypothetical protein